MMSTRELSGEPGQAPRSTFEVGTPLPTRVLIDTNRDLTVQEDEEAEWLPAPELMNMIAAHDPDWVMMIEGAGHALCDGHPDHPRHVATSLRAVLMQTVDRYVPRRKGEPDRKRLHAFLGSRSGAKMVDLTIGRLSKLVKGPPASRDDAIAALYATCGSLTLILARVDRE